MHRPIQGARVVRDVQDNGVRVFGRLVLGHHETGTAVVDDYGEELERVDRDIWVLLVHERHLLDLFWELEVPPGMELSGVSSAHTQRAVAEDLGEGHPRDEERNRGAELDSRVWLEDLANEIELFPHAWVDLVGVACPILLWAAFFRGKANVLGHVRGLAMDCFRAIWSESFLNSGEAMMSRAPFCLRANAKET